jgi:hypothetical protein
MKLLRLLVVIGISACAFTPAVSLAQTPAAEASVPLAVVKQIKIENNVRPPFGDPAPWFEAEVQVEARPGGRATSGEYLDKVRCTFYYAYRATRGAESPILIYKTTVDAVSVEGGISHNFRFYLPPAIVKRDKPGSEGDFYYAVLEVDDKPQTVAPQAASRSMPKDPQNFIARANTDATKNEGVLLPQYSTPFELDPKRPMPAYVRRDAR